MKVSHIHRLLRLITLLQSEEDVSVAELADIFRVSRRTVFRDISSVKRAGIPISFDSACGHYVIGSDFFLPPLGLTEREARSLMLLARLAVDTWKVPFAGDIETALEKITCTLPLQTKTESQEAIQVIDARSGPLRHGTSSTTVFDAVWHAAIMHQVLEIRCEAPPLGREISTRFHPYRVIWTVDGWHIAGYNERDRTITLLNLDWIIHAAPTQERFAPAPFAAHEFFGNAWKIEKGHRRFHVRVCFAARVALAVDDVLWHPTQQTEFLHDGSLLLEVDIDGLNEICPWILGYGPDAVVEAPVELRELVQARSRQVALLYKEQRVTHHPAASSDDPGHGMLTGASGLRQRQEVVQITADTA